MGIGFSGRGSQPGLQGNAISTPAGYGAEPRPPNGYCRILMTTPDTYLLTYLPRWTNVAWKTGIFMSYFLAFVFILLLSGFNMFDALYDMLVALVALCHL